MTSALEQIIKVVECERRQPMQVGFGYAFERNFLHDTLPWPICAPAPHTAHTGDGEGKHEGRFDGSSLSPPGGSNSMARKPIDQRQKSLNRCGDSSV